MTTDNTSRKVLILVNHDIVLYNFRKELVERLLLYGYQVIVSSPYGERIGGDIDSLYGMIGTTLKHKYADTDAWIISSNKRGFDQIGLKPNDKIMLQNAEIDCQYRHYHLFPGKLKTYKSANKE